MGSLKFAAKTIVAVILCFTVILATFFGVIACLDLLFSNGNIFYAGHALQWWFPFAGLGAAFFALAAAHRLLITKSHDTTKEDAK